MFMLKTFLIDKNYNDKNHEGFIPSFFMFIRTAVTLQKPSERPSQGPRRPL